MFSIFNIEQSKPMKNFYPKGFKLDLCSIPLMMTAEHEKINLGYCGNTCWFVFIDRQDDKFTFNLICEPAKSCLAGFDQWKVKADVTIRLLNHKSNNNSMSFSEFERKFSKDNILKHDYEKALFHNKSEFLLNGVAMFQIIIGINSLEELYSGNFINFSVPREGETDVVLIVRDKKFHVSKQILAINSQVFATMFDGNFNETHKSEIPIKNVDLDAFHLLLQYIYFAPIEICEGNVSQMLLMGDQFEVKRLIRACEKFLLRKDIDQNGAIELAILHNLERVLCEKINEKSVEDLELWWSTNPQLPLATRNFLVEKLSTSEKVSLENQVAYDVSSSISDSLQNQSTDSNV